MVFDYVALLWYNASIESITGHMRTMNQTETKVDSTTSLQWLLFTDGQTYRNGQIVGTPKKFTWNDAMCVNKKFIGFSDWRIPTYSEFLSVKNLWRDTIDEWIWTSTQSIDDGKDTHAYCVHTRARYNPSMEIASALKDNLFCRVVVREV